MELDGIESRYGIWVSRISGACWCKAGNLRGTNVDERDAEAVIDLEEIQRLRTNELDARFHEIILWSSRTMLQLLRKRLHLKDIDKQRGESSDHLSFYSF